jgi:hypothetical protein
VPQDGGIDRIIDEVLKQDDNQASIDGQVRQLVAGDPRARLPYTRLQISERELKAFIDVRDRAEFGINLAESGVLQQSVNKTSQAGHTVGDVAEELALRRPGILLDTPLGTFKWQMF